MRPGSSEPTADSADLLRASEAGDSSALEALLVRHLPNLRAFVRVQCSPRVRLMESCSDLVASVCREILTRPERFEFQGEPAFRSWLFGAALHKIRDRERYYRAERRNPGMIQAQDSGQDPANLADLGTSYAPFLSPSEAAIRREEIERLEAAFDRLDDNDRMLLALHRFAGVSHRQIAEEQGKSEAAVRQAVHRAIARLAAVLTES